MVLTDGITENCHQSEESIQQKMFGPKRIIIKRLKPPLT